MEAGLDNANNPFTSPNGSLKNLGAETDNLQKSNNDGLLLNLSESFKSNGTDLSKDIFGTEKLNGSRKSASDLHFDDEFGPETNVDTVDDVLSPIEKEKAFTESLVKGLKDESIPSFLNDEDRFSESLINNNPLESALNPFLNNQQGQTDTLTPKELNFDDDFTREDREETPTPPVDAVQDGGGLEVNPTESDSEDEWNYIKGDQANPENISLQPETVVETAEPDDAMSQLNPNAAEFVPVSPTRSIPSPACRVLFNDEVISESPKRPARVDIFVPSETEFETEVKSRPSDFDKNGDKSDDELNSPGVEPIEKILNGRSVDEIPEFQPGNTPVKPASEEFHFGPNAAPFIPELSDSAHHQSKLLDQSEAFSTKAEYGDDTYQLLNASLDNECPLPNKEQTDPMSMSIYAEKGENNPFQDSEDLNKVHDLPENLEAFLGVEGSNNKENISFNETISDLPEHDPLEHLVDNDIAAVQTTDLDKLSQDDEKELASPLEENSEPLDSNVVTRPNEIVSDVDIHESENGYDVALSPELELVASPEPLESPVPPSEPVAPSPQPDLVPASEPTVEVSSEVSLIPSALDQLEVVEKADTYISQNEVPKEISNTLDVGIPEVDILHATDSAVESPIDLVPPQCELTAVKEDLQQEFEPKKEVEFLSGTLNQGDLCDLSVSPVPACEYSADPGSCVIPPRDLPLGDSQSPVDLLQDHKQEEEITSSVKDDVSSPVEPLSQASLVEDSPKDDVAEASKPVEVTEIQHQAVDILSDLTCPLPSSQPLIQPDVVSTFEQSSPAEQLTLNGLDSDITGNNEQICIRTDSIKPEYPESEILTPSEESRGLDEPNAFSPLPSQTETPVDVPQDTLEVQSEPEPVVASTLPVQLEPEPVVQALTNQLESKPVVDSTLVEQLETEPIVDSTPALLSELETVVESTRAVQSESQPVVDSTPAAQLEPEPVVASVVPQIELATPIESVVPLIKIDVAPPSSEAPSKQSKTADKDKKKPIGKVEPRKSPAASPRVGEVKPLTKSSISPRAAPSTKVPPKTGTTKPTTAAPKASPRPITKPKTAPTTSKPTETKAPVANAKPVPKTITRKAPVEAPATKTINRPTTAPAARASPTKPTAPRPTTTASRTTLQSKSTTATAPPKTTVTAKPRVPLSSRTTSTASSRTTATTTITKTTTTTTKTLSSSPKAPVAAPKPRTTTSAAPKPRVPASKTVTKSADVEKEKKESANKLAASRTTTVSRTTATNATGRTQTVGVKKTEVKSLSDRTVASKTTTTKTTTLSKKPGEVKAVARAKTTKIEKPKQNGIAPTSVTEEINIVNNVVNQSDSESLVKDNSPLDNKLLIETSNSLVDTTPAD